MKLYGNKRRFKTIKSVIDTLRNKAVEGDYNVGIFESLIGINTKCQTRGEYDDNRYNLNMEFWGTPNDYLPDDEFEIYEEDDYLVMTFITNHSPCDSFFVHLCEMYGLHGFIIYDNEENDFYGRTDFKENGQWEDKCYDYLEGQYRLNPDDFWENITGNQFEYWYDDGADIEEELAEMDYLTQDDKKELLESYNQYIKS
jgi:hypothetical protein